MIDYRIASAMINFTHRPICPDKDKASLIANRMKKKASFDTNQLAYLLKKHLDTKEIKKIELADLEDFPKLNKNTIIEKLFYGTFHFKQAFSYVEDFLKSGNIYLVNKRIKLKKVSNEEKSKIIAAEIISRHRRSIKKNISKKKKVSSTNNFRNPYKVFIEYIPFNNHSKAIKGNLNIP